jgi:hypothetical protein
MEKIIMEIFLIFIIFIILSLILIRAHIALETTYRVRMELINSLFEEKDYYKYKFFLDEVSFMKHLWYEFLFMNPKKLYASELQSKF